jgi:CBS domain-containing protein
MLIADLVRHKTSTVRGAAVVTISAHEPVTELLKHLEEHHIGGVPVMDGDALVGIVSERDVVRRLGRDGAAVLTASIGDIMTADVLSCSPGDSVDQVATIMTEHRFRHMPVVADGRLVGIVTIGDVVAARLRSLESERRQLEDYITRG